MFDYSPLFKTLDEKGLNRNFISETFNKKLLHKLDHNSNMNIETIARICIELDVPIEKVVKINRIKQK